MLNEDPVVFMLDVDSTLIDNDCYAAEPDSQSGALYSLMSDDQNAQLIGNLVGALNEVPRAIHVRQTGHFCKTDPERGSRLADGLGIRGLTRSLRQSRNPTVPKNTLFGGVRTLKWLSGTRAARAVRAIGDAASGGERCGQQRNN